MNFANIAALKRQIDEMAHALYRPAKEEISICIQQFSVNEQFSFFKEF